MSSSAKEWFSTADLVNYGGLPSKHMVAYLCRTGILEPSLTEVRRRGIKRRFSYQDLLLVRSISTLLDAGVSVFGIQEVLKTLREKLGVDPARALSKQYVSIIGKSVYIGDSPEALVELTAAGQLAFQFVLDVTKPEKVSKAAPQRASRARRISA